MVLVVMCLGNGMFFWGGSMGCDHGWEWRAGLVRFCWSHSASPLGESDFSSSLLPTNHGERLFPLFTLVQEAV